MIRVAVHGTVGGYGRISQCLHHREVFIERDRFAGAIAVIVAAISEVVSLALGLTVVAFAGAPEARIFRWRDVIGFFVVIAQVEL